MSRILIAPFVLGLCIVSQVPAQSPSYRLIGSGCVGSAGVPHLEADPLFPPVLGGTFRARLRNLPEGTAIGILGFSNTEWRGFSLPLELGFLGMPGCRLFTGIRHTVQLTDLGGRASWDTEVPDRADLVGLSFFQQVFILDPRLPGLGAVVSDAAEGVIGVQSPAPLATVYFPRKRSLTDEDSILVRGGAADPDGVNEVRVNGLLASTSDGFMNWEVRVPLDHGVNTLRVSTRDNLGMASPLAAEVVVESQAQFRGPLGGLAVDSPRDRLLVAESGIVAVSLSSGDRRVFSDDEHGTGIGFDRPLGIAADDSNAYVIDLGLFAVISVDLATGNRQLVSGPSKGTGPAITPTAIVVDGSRVLVAGSVAITPVVVSEGVVAIDLASGDRTILTLAHLSSFLGLSGMTLVGSELYLLDHLRKAVFVLDLSTGITKLVSGNGLGSGPNIERPRSIVVDGSRALVTDQSTGSVIAVDLATGNRTHFSNANHGTGQSFSTPFGIVIEGLRALVGDPGQHSLISVDLATGNRSLLSADRIGTGPALLGTIAFTSDGDRALLTNRELQAAVAVDLVSGTRTVVSDAMRGSGPAFQEISGIALNGDEVLIADSIPGRPSLGRIFSVDPDTGTRIVVSDESRGEGVPLIDPTSLTMDGPRLLVGERLPHSLLAIDMATGDRQVISDADTGSGPNFRALLGLALAGGEVLVAGGTKGGLMAVELGTGTRRIVSDENTGNGPSLFFPYGIVRDGSRAIVTARLLDAVVSIELATGNRTMIADRDRGRGPDFGDPVGIGLRGGQLFVMDSDLGAVFFVDQLSGERVVISR